MSRMVSRTISAISTYPPVVTSPAMWTWPVVIRVSTATRLRGSWRSIASRIASLIWSAILSGWPSVTDSDVKRRRDTRCLPATAGGWTEPRLPPRLPALADDEHVAALARELGPGVGEHVAFVVPGLGGEPDDQLAGRALGDQLGQHIGIACQRHAAGLATAVLLQLGGRRGLGPEVGDGRAHHDDVGSVGLGEHGGAQLLGRADRDRPDPERGRQLD